MHIFDNQLHSDFGLPGDVVYDDDDDIQCLRLAEISK